MKYTVRLRDEADRELTTAATWYEQQLCGLGDIVVVAILHGSRHPRRWQNRP